MKNFLKDFELAFQWSCATYHDLPWRKKRSFYSTLISEVMLQQTTVATVKARFATFLQTFPDLKSLSLANEDELLRLWQGLGYYNRARRLKAAAKILNEKKDYTVESLLKVPGIGDYTANALMAIGLNKPAFAIDVNLERVLIRYFGSQRINGKLEHSKDNLKTFFHKKIVSAVSDYKSFHEVLMDIGRTFCQARSRNCLQCPLKNGCESFKENQDLFEAVKVVKLKKKSEVEILRMFIQENEKMYLVQRGKGQWLEGQWEVPSFVLKGSVAEKQYGVFLNQPIKIAYEFISTITHHRFLNKVTVMDEKSVQKFKLEGKWFSLEVLKTIPLTSVTLKILKKPRSA